MLHMKHPFRLFALFLWTLAWLCAFATGWPLHTPVAAALPAGHRLSALVTPALNCTVDPVQSYGYANPAPYPVNSSLIYAVSVAINNTTLPPVNMQTATFTWTYSGGGRTYTYTHRHTSPDSNNSYDIVTVPLPSVVGIYTTTCRFEGQGTWGPAQMTLVESPLIVSTNHSIGGIEFSTNPATIKNGAPATWNVTVLPGSSLPVPTGNIEIVIGNSNTPQVALQAGGTVSFQANAPSILGPITVVYHGDPVYGFARQTFSSLTNPPPASNTTPTPSANTPSASTPAAVATPAARPTATPAARPTATTSATLSVSPTAAPTATAITSGTSRTEAVDPLVWAVPGSLLVLAGGGLTGALFFRRRARRSPSAPPFPPAPATEATTPIEPPETQESRPGEE